MNRYIYYWLCVFVAPFGFKWMIKKCPYGYVDACPIVSPPFKDISRETEKNKGIAPIYVTNHYKWRFFAFDLYVVKIYYYIKLRLIRAKALIIKLSYLSGSSGFCWPFTI